MKYTLKILALLLFLIGCTSKNEMSQNVTILTCDYSLSLTEDWTIVDTLNQTPILELNEIFILNYINKNRRINTRKVLQFSKYTDYHNYQEQSFLTTTFLNESDTKTKIDFRNDNNTFTVYCIHSKELYFMLQKVPNNQITWFKLSNSKASFQISRFLNDNFKSEIDKYFKTAPPPEMTDNIKKKQ